jgi:arylsulfatase A-like enzyme
MATAPKSKRPNILVIWGDDIGVWNLSRYNHGMMFTDSYGEQSCTANYWRPPESNR